MFGRLAFTTSLSVCAAAALAQTAETIYGGVTILTMDRGLARFAKARDIAPGALVIIEVRETIKDGRTIYPAATH